MVKISALPAMTSPDGADPAPVVDDSAGQTKKITLTKLKEWLQSLTGWITTAMLADSAVTPAKWQNLYMFRAYRNSAQNTGNNAFAKVAFDSESYDRNNNFDSTTNNRYVAPVAGYFHFDWMVILTQSGGGTYDSALYKNGSEVSHGGRDNINTVQVDTQGSDTLQAAASDYFEVYSRSSTGAQAITTGANNCYFSGYCVSQ